MTVKNYTKDIHGKDLPHVVPMDEFLYENHLTKLPVFIENEWDCWGIFVGDEGSGKSHMAQRVALLLNADTTLKHVVFTFDQLEELIEDCDKGTVIIYDEANILGDAWNSSQLKRFIRLSKKIREKFCYVLLCTPTLRDMNSNFVRRARFVCYVFARTPTQRGYYHYYASEKRIYLYNFLKDKRVEVPSIYHDAYGTIKNGFIGTKIDVKNWYINKKEYQEKKFASDESDDQLSNKQLQLKLRREWLVNFFRWHNQKYGKDPIQNDAAAIFDTDRSNIARDLNSLEWSV